MYWQSNVFDQIKNLAGLIGMRGRLQYKNPYVVGQQRSKRVYTIQIQAGSHKGDAKHITQWRSKAVPTTEIQAGSHNQRSKPVPTTEIQTGSQSTLHNGDPRRFTQRRSKPVPTMRNCPGG